MRLPILMYHKVGATVTSSADTFLNVSAPRFAGQMRLLKRLRYEGITLAQGWDCLSGGCPLPPRPVCITFDDGYGSVAEHAAPVLNSLGWPATVFVPTAHVGGTNIWDRDTGRPLQPILGWDALGRLQDG